MIIEKFEILGKNGRRCQRATLQCDACQTIFTNKHGRQLKKPDHWCSIKCANEGMKKGGVINVRIEKSWQERFGVSHPMLDSGIQQKHRKTCFERFGVESPLQSQAIQNTRKMNYKETHGYEHPMQNPSVMSQFKETMLLNHGVAYPTQSADIQATRRQNSLKRHGVDHPMKIPKIVLKMLTTSRKRYGYHGFGRRDIYGPERRREMTSKSLETLKARNSYHKSKAEDAFFNFLVQRFGEYNVERQKKVKNWPIDLYVKSIDTYVQIDGVYWHGLDRALEEHQATSTLRSKNIIKKWHTDREQEQWFKGNDLRLLRITDIVVHALQSLPDDLASIAYFAC